jgi:hypothetical protein
MGETQQLGTDFATWAIKGFSVKLREAIMKAARQQDWNVAEWLHAHFQKFGVDGLQVDVVKIDPVSPPQDDELHRLVASAALLAQHGEKMPPKLRGALARALRERVPPPRRAVALLPAPEMEAAA